MDYRRFIASKNVDFKVNDHLIECGSTTWQIRNIAATSIDRKVVPFNEPEPRFETAEPKLELNISAITIASAIAWVLVYFILGYPNLAIVVALGVGGAMIYAAVESLNKKKLHWLSAKRKVERHWEVWNQLRRNPPVLYSLMLETNAGSKPLFYSFDEPQIAKANDTIKRSMEKKESGDIKFEIETVNVGGEESINNFGSSIYNQSIQGA
jgi:hypothetical protein